MAVWLAYQNVFDALRNRQPVNDLNPEWGALADLTTATLPLEATRPRSAGNDLAITHINPLKAHRASTGEMLTVEFVTINPVTGEITVTDATDDDLRLVRELIPQIWSRPGPTSVSPAHTPEHPDGPRLSELWDGFAEESMKDTRQKSQDTVRQSLNVFIETVGDLPANQLDRGAARRFAKALSDYPARRNVGGRKQLTLEEVKAGEYQAIAARTQVNITGDLRNFANWLVEIGVLDSNPFIKGKKKRQQSPAKRKTWTHNELALWFSSDLYLKHRGSIKEPWKFWLPLLAIHSGARLEEMAALAPTDIQEHEGIHFFEIHGRDGRHVKNASSWRYVPIHSRLIELGFLDYVASRNGEERLFNLVPYQNEYGKNASKAFGYIRKKLKIEPTFHGYRHTVAETLRLNNTRAEHITWLMGHSGKTMTDHYGSDADKRHRLPLLKELVETLDWRLVLCELVG